MWGKNIQVQQKVKNPIDNKGNNDTESMLLISFGWYTLLE